MQPKQLTELGFSENETKVYLALLEMGISTITTIISRTHLHKQIVYDNLNRLIDKGLISYVIQSNRKHFSAASPERIKDVLDEQKREIEDKEELLKKILPELLIKKELAKEKQVATIYQDKKGIKSILENILEQKEEVLAFGAEGRFKKVFGPYWINYNKRREKIKQKWRIVWSEKLKNKREEIKFVKVKYISKKFENPASTIIFGDNTAIIIWEDIPFAILIESSKITESYKSTFTLLWKLAKK